MVTIVQRRYVVWVLLVLVLRISDLAELSQGRRERVCRVERQSMKGSSMQAQDKDNRQSSFSQAAPLKGGGKCKEGHDYGQGKGQGKKSNAACLVSVKFNPVLPNDCQGRAALHSLHHVVDIVHQEQGRQSLVLVCLCLQCTVILLL